jgi:hypothetical protein
LLTGPVIGPLVSGLVTLVLLLPPALLVLLTGRLAEPAARLLTGRERGGGLEPTLISRATHGGSAGQAR